MRKAVIWLLLVIVIAAVVAGGARFAATMTYPSALDSLRPDISYELGWTPPGLSPDEKVHWWLTRHKRMISATAARWRVDPAEIADVIAYESLDNPEPWMFSILTRYAGPGKVHFKETRFSEQEPIAKEVEDLGYLPKRTWQKRRAILSTDQGAITYIAAILSALAKAARQHGYDVRCNHALLLTLYSAWNLRDLNRHLQTTDGRPLALNDAGYWLQNYRNVATTAIPSSCPDHST